MRLERVTPQSADLYINYARRHGPGHDESFIPDRNFVPDGDFPAFLLFGRVRGNKTVIGAAGLMITAPYRNAGRARVTVLHASRGGLRAYRSLTRALRKVAGTALYGFLPAKLSRTGAIWQRIGWKEERRSYLLVNNRQEIPDDTPPGGFFWDCAAPDDTEKLQIWRDLVNRNFAEMAGHVELTFERTRTLAGAKGVLGNGLMLLCGPEGATGTIHTEVDDDDPRGSFLAAISLLADYRGRGLGRLILRRGLAVSRRAGLSPTWLSVNAENEKALGLYRSEGFTLEKEMICYALPPRRDKHRAGDKTAVLMGG